MALASNTCGVSADLRKNWLILTFKGIVTKTQMRSLYTDVRFNVADLQPRYNVISDFSECKFMYLNSLATFRQIFHYMLTNNSGEVVRIINPKRVISKQIINLTLQRPGYKPTYAANREEAEKKITQSARRESLRFQLHGKQVSVVLDAVPSVGAIIDISIGGCAITSAQTHPQHGDEVQLKFNFSGQSAIEEFVLQARVVRVDGQTFAVQFVGMTSHQQSLLWGCLVAESEAVDQPST